jgi:hypothetical protein
MKRKRLSGVAKEILILFGAMTVAVFAYNTWAYCCGRCSMGTFMTIGPTGMGLLGANLVAFAVLVFLRLRRRRASSGRACSCGTSLGGDWHFCPDCGRPADASAA